MLFDGTNLDEWVNTRDKAPAGVDRRRRRDHREQDRSATSRRSAASPTISCTSSGGSRRTSPATDSRAATAGCSSPRPARGDGGYELQILDSYNNKTYVNGQAGSVYKQFPPLVNASRKPGEWQAYDVVWTAPTFNADGR